MRTLQVILFALGAVAFVGALFFVGQGTGETLWKVGVGMMLVVLALANLWPTAQKS